MNTQNGAPIANVASIEDQIRTLWQEIGESNSSKTSVVTRVCTLTLIAYGANTELARRVRTAVPAIFSDHPCRAILIEADGAADELSAWVTTVCQRAAEGAEQVCCEQITFTVGETMRRRLPGTVLPLVVSDLPVFVWWPGPFHAASNVRTQLFAHADRWLTDSRDFAAPLADLSMLHAMIKSDPSTAVTDLEWARLTLWRSMLARVFDQPTMRPALDHISTLTLRSKTVRSSALLCIGWLASRLRWQVASHITVGDATTYHFTAAHGEVQVIVQADETTDDGLSSLVLGWANQPDLTVTLARNANSQTLVSTVQHGAETTTHVGEMRDRADGALLIEELNGYGRDRVYEAALALVAKLVTVI